jgi:hypothetical protein
LRIPAAFSLHAVNPFSLFYPVRTGVYRFGKIIPIVKTDCISGFRARILVVIEGGLSKDRDLWRDMKRISIFGGVFLARKIGPACVGCGTVPAFAPLERFLRTAACM